MNINEKGPFLTEDKEKVKEFVDRKKLEQENKFREELDLILEPLYDALDSFQETLKKGTNKINNKSLDGNNNNEG